MSSLLICCMTWFLPAFIFPGKALFFHTPSMSFLSKEIDTVPLLGSSTYSRWGPFRQMWLSWETDHKTSLFFAPGLYEWSPGITLCEYVHRERMGDLFALGGPPSVHCLNSLPEKEGQWGQILRVPARKQIATRFCIYLPCILGISATKENLQR